MSRKRGIWLSVGGVAIVVLVIGAFVFQPWLLWIDEKVDEVDEASEVVSTATGGLDDTGGPSAESTSAEPSETATKPSSKGSSQPPSTEPTEVPVEPETEEPPKPTRVQLAAGDFIDAEHGTAGKALIYRRSDGSRYLRLADLNTSNGPDLHVWITDQPSGGTCQGCRDSWGIYDDNRYVKLGELKGNQGSQNYEIPGNANLSGMKSVVIWCDRFNVAFGTAAVG